MGETRQAPPITIVNRAEDTEAVLATIDLLAASIPERHQPNRVVLDALLSLYLRVAVEAYGIDGTRLAIERAQRQIPRVTAALRADQARGGSDATNH